MLIGKQTNRNKQQRACSFRLFVSLRLNRREKIKLLLIYYLQCFREDKERTVRSSSRVRRQRQIAKLFEQNLSVYLTFLNKGKGRNNPILLAGCWLYFLFPLIINFFFINLNYIYSIYSRNNASTFGHRLFND